MVVVVVKLLVVTSGLSNDGSISCGVLVDAKVGEMIVVVVVVVVVMMVVEMVMTAI